MEESIHIFFNWLVSFWCWYCPRMSPGNWYFLHVNVPWKLFSPSHPRIFFWYSSYQILCIKFSWSFISVTLTPTSNNRLHRLHQCLDIYISCDNSTLWLLVYFVPVHVCTWPNLMHVTYQNIWPPFLTPGFIWNSSTNSVPCLSIIFRFPTGFIAT